MSQELDTEVVLILKTLIVRLRGGSRPQNNSCCSCRPLMCALQAYMNLLATVNDPCNTQTQVYCQATEERQCHCRSHTARVPTFGYKFDICVVNHQISRRGAHANFENNSVFVPCR